MLYRLSWISCFMTSFNFSLYLGQKWKNPLKLLLAICGCKMYHVWRESDEKVTKDDSYRRRTTRTCTKDQTSTSIEAWWVFGIRQPFVEFGYLDAQTHDFRRRMLQLMKPSSHLHIAQECRTVRSISGQRKTDRHFSLSVRSWTWLRWLYYWWKINMIGWKKVSLPQHPPLPRRRRGSPFPNPHPPRPLMSHASSSASVLPSPPWPICPTRRWRGRRGAKWGRGRARKSPQRERPTIWPLPS